MEELTLNQNITVIGHKNPDTDSICSAIGYTALKNANSTNTQYIAKRAGKVSPETAFVLDRFGVDAPELLENGAGETFILVDHNEASQAVDGLELDSILEIIDHHKIGGIKTTEPIYFRNQPVGCTATIVYQMYQESGVEVEKSIAALLCSAILSDTLAFRSPTCTDFDKEAATSLAKVAGISDVETYAREMFKAGSDLLTKDAKEIFYLDFKKFESKKATFGVGQVTSMDQEELAQLKEKLVPYMQETFKEHEVDMLFFLLTDILEESSELIYIGDHAKEVVAQAFTSSREDITYLKGVVSRKKQIIPQLMAVLDK